ncbi:MAG: hypothetical protein ACRELG_28695 [Gemmataceae bacterium]
MSTKDSEENPIVTGILDDADDHIDLSVGVMQMQMPDSRYILEEDYRVAGEVWRVHKSDPDPYTSQVWLNPPAKTDRGVQCWIGC